MNKSTAFIRTDKAIQNTFIQLLKENSFEKITVQDILDATPVSRATFYKHYQDKYEIAEKMLEEYYQKYNKVFQDFLSSDISDYSKLIRNASDNNKDFMNALFKIHTDRVNLQETLLEDQRNDYLKSAVGPTAKQEAEIYAAIRVTLQRIYMNTMDSETIINMHPYRLLGTVFLRMFDLKTDQKSLDYLKEIITTIDS
ncbi:MAG: TetR/AcrR family transcriptional regulator [Erysipelotrichaceae bacterium]|nr:TetR/AcrR family transcriptional regulator [Erysipelotrichaceae bacterium]